MARGIALVLWLIMLGGVLATAAPQVELDRIVSRVAGRAITTLDVRQARLMRLVADTASDAVVLRQLEDRSLASSEVTRALASIPVTDAAVAAHRAEWERGVGGSEAARRLMAEHEMTDADLTAWFRDDLRIAQLIERQFGALSGPERARATADWYARLRQRADLR
jgi:hypothetical protein